MIGTIIKEKKIGQRHRKNDVRMAEAEIRLMQLEAKEYQGLLPTTRS